jgi:cytochrome o ubiquinol oxidase operon protein cyoD
LSAHPSHGDSAHGSADHADSLHSHGDTHGHGTRRSYLIGFALSVILTAIPFWLVMSHAIQDTQTIALIIFAMAAVQVIVHVIYFLHLDSRAEGGWTLVSFIFTVVVVAITIGGSTWVMYHLNSNMMPMSPEALGRP